MYDGYIDGNICETVLGGYSGIYIYIFENMIWVLYLKIGRVVYLNLWPSNDTEDGD